MAEARLQKEPPQQGILYAREKAQHLQAGGDASQPRGRGMAEMELLLDDKDSVLLSVARTGPSGLDHGSFMLSRSEAEEWRPWLPPIGGLLGLQQSWPCGEGRALFTPQIFTDNVPSAGPSAKALGSGPALSPLLLSHSSRPWTQGGEGKRQEPGSARPAWGWGGREQ